MAGILANMLLGGVQGGAAATGAIAAENIKNTKENAKDKAKRDHEKAMLKISQEYQDGVYKKNYEDTHKSKFYDGDYNLTDRELSLLNDEDRKKLNNRKTQQGILSDRNSAALKSQRQFELTKVAAGLRDKYGKVSDKEVGRQETAAYRDVVAMADGIGGVIEYDTGGVAKGMTVPADKNGTVNSSIIEDIKSLGFNAVKKPTPEKTKNHLFSKDKYGVYISLGGWRPSKTSKREQPAGEEPITGTTLSTLITEVEATGNEWPQKTGAKAEQPVESQAPKVGSGLGLMTTPEMIEQKRNQPVSNQPGVIDKIKEGFKKQPPLQKPVYLQPTRPTNQTGSSGILQNQQPATVDVKAKQVPVTDEIDGKQVEFPLIYPGISTEDMAIIENPPNGRIPQYIIEQAKAYARQRMTAGLPLFEGGVI